MSMEFYFNKYINMNNYERNWCFQNEPKVNEQDIKFIKPLSKEYSAFLWERYVSKNNRHIMLLDKKEWPCLLIQEDYNWQNDWNKNNYNSFRYFLAKRVSFDDDDIIYIFWMKEQGIETTWNVFLKYWVNFLYDDEGVVLIGSNNDDSLMFGPNGLILSGKRKIMK